MAREELPQIFVGSPVLEIGALSPFDGIGHFGGKAPISNRTGNRLMEPDCAANAKVVGILHAVADPDLFAFDPDVGDPMLAATVRAPSHMQFQVLLEAGQAVFQFLDQPAGESLRLRDRKLAEFRATASNRTAPEY